MDGGVEAQQRRDLARQRTFRRSQHVDAEVFGPVGRVGEFQIPDARQHLPHAGAFAQPAGHQVRLVAIGAGDQRVHIAAFDDAGLFQHGGTRAVAADDADVLFLFETGGGLGVALDDHHVPPFGGQGARHRIPHVARAYDHYLHDLTLLRRSGKNRFAAFFSL